MHSMYCPLTLCRYWLLYFKTQFAMAQSDGEWRGIIDPNEVDRNWWILNKKRFGSGHFLKKYVVSLWAAIVALEGSLWLWFYIDGALEIQAVVVTLDAIILIVPLMLTVYIRQSLPVLRDKLRIKQVIHCRKQLQSCLSVRESVHVFCVFSTVSYFNVTWNLSLSVHFDREQELKHIFLIILLAFIVIAVLSSTVGALAVWLDEFDAAMGRTVYVAVSNVSTLGTFLCIYVQTQWVMHKFRSHLQTYSSRRVLQNSLTQEILETKKQKISDKEKISIPDPLVLLNTFITEQCCGVLPVSPSSFRSIQRRELKEWWFEPSQKI